MENIAIARNQALRISRFAQKFVNGSIVAWFHSLKMEPLFISKAISDPLSGFEKAQMPETFLEKIITDQKEIFLKIISKLYSSGILVKEQHDEFEELKKLQEKFLQEPAIGILYLLLDDRCNFRCDYCFLKNALATGRSFSSMNRDTAKKTLDRYSQLLSKNAGRKTIIFYGGEPLINSDILKFCLEYIRELKEKDLLPADQAVTINTNGSLIDERIANLFCEHDVAVSVSIDGPEYIHDQRRRFVNGQGTFREVIRGFNLLKDKKVNVGISCTVAEHNLDQLPEIVDWFISDLGISFLGLNPLTDLPGETLSSEEYVKRFTEASIQCFIKARKAGLYEDRMMRKVEAFVEKRIYPFDCAGCGRQLVASPEGKMGVCHAYAGTNKYFTDTCVEKLDPNKEPIWQEWCKRSPLGMSQCFDCAALGICGGGCPYNADLTSGSIWNLDPYFCTYSKRILEWLIWDVYDHARKRIKKD
jgi:uncharacterized protein